MSVASIGLDLGSSSVKGIALVPRRRRPATTITRRRISTRAPGPGRIEQDAAEIASASVEVLLEIARRAGGGAPDAAGPPSLGIATQRSTILFWDRGSGRPLTPAYSWLDRRGGVQCDRLLRRGARTAGSGGAGGAGTADLIAARTGLRLSPHYSASKLAWALRNVPGLRRRVSRGTALWGTLGTFLVWRLSGGSIYAIDHANAQRTSLMNLAPRAWDPDLFDLFGLQPLLDAPALPALIPTFPDGDLELRVGSRRLRLGTLTGDQQAAVAGLVGLRDEGRLVINYGTGAFVLRTGVAGSRVPRGLLKTLIASWREEHGPGGSGGDSRALFALEGTVNAAATAVDWALRRLRLRLRVADLDRFLGPPPGGDRTVHFLPAVGGLGAPHWDPRARPAFSGDVRGAADRDLVRAAIESIAQRCAEIALRTGPCGGAGADRPARRRRAPAVFVSGGLAVCRTLLQAQADLLQCSVIVEAFPDATAIGAAWMSALDPAARARRAGRWVAGRPPHPGGGRAGRLVVLPRIDPREAARRRRNWRRAVYGPEGLSAAGAGG